MALTQVFQNTIAVESFTREAAMIESLGCENLTNLKGRIDKKKIKITYSQPSLARRLLRKCRQLGLGQKEEVGNISPVQGLQDIPTGGRKTDQTS